MRQFSSSSFHQIFVPLSLITHPIHIINKLLFKSQNTSSGVHQRFLEVSLLEPSSFLINWSIFSLTLSNKLLLSFRSSEIFSDKVSERVSLSSMSSLPLGDEPFSLLLLRVCKRSLKSAVGTLRSLAFRIDSI